MTTGFIICGALGREVVEIINKHGWDAEVIGVPASDHLFPARIAPDVAQRILQVQNQYNRLVVVFGDCGTAGALDKVLSQHNVKRVQGLHCYEMYCGAHFATLTAAEPATFFLTDFLVRTFKGSVLRGLGLDRFPELKDDYFGNYKRVVYLAQTDNPDLQAKAGEIAAYLACPLTIVTTGTHLLERQLVALMEG